MDRLRERRGVEYKPESFEVGRLGSGEVVIGDLDGSPDIHIPDNDFAKRADYRNTELAREALSHIEADNEGYNGEYIVRSHTFPVKIGVNTCVKTEAGAKIIRAFRPSSKTPRSHPTRFVIAQVGEPTDTITFILQRRLEINPNTMSIVAAYMGERANPEPVGRFATARNKRFWRNHALVLQELGQIDPSRPIAHGDQGQEMSYRGLESLFEATERTFLIEKTIEHMRDGEFGPRYVQMAQARETRATLWIDEAAGEETSELVEKEIQAFAFVSLIRQLQLSEQAFRHWQYIIPGSTRAVQPHGWKKLVHHARLETGVEISRGKALKKYLARTYLPQVKKGYEYTQAATRVKASMEHATRQATKEVNQLLRELDARKNDPDFVEAAYSWTNAPDSDGNIGRSGRAFSGGLVHFFEYRSGLKKRERFKTIKEPMSVDGFIAFTGRLKTELQLAEELLENPDLPSKNHVVVLGDKSGNRRFYILQPNKDLIIAYQKSGHPTKLSTMITDCSPHYLESVIQASIDKKDKKIRINKLGPENIRRLATRLPPIN